MNASAPALAPTTRRNAGKDRRTAMRRAATEYDLMATTLAQLTPEDWTLRTACTAWDVRQLGCHMVGMAAMTSNPLETQRQQKKAARISAQTKVTPLDALTGLQVDERADWTPAQVVQGARAIGPKASRGRRLTPPFIRSRDLPEAQQVNGYDETWSIGYLLDVILTRDPWMHRMDLALATGREPHLTAEHDGALIADVVAEWATRHGQPFALELTGPAGGSWEVGQGGQRIEMDAIDFCRILSGRGTGEGLLACQVPF